MTADAEARAWPAQWLVPDWPAPPHVHAVITTRAGGSSKGPYGVPPDGTGGMNIGRKSGESLDIVEANRARLAQLLPSAPRWLSQIHGADVVAAEDADAPLQADAATSVTPGVVCAVTIADCLPVLFADARGRAVGAAHAGWRGLAAGVIQRTAEHLRRRLQDAQAPLVAYLGPAIGPKHFEVGAEVREAMRAHLPDADTAFRDAASAGKFYADLPALARQALGCVGVTRVFGGDQCTYSDPARYYSYRRDRVTGRHVALIWIEDPRSRSAGQ